MFIRRQLSCLFLPALLLLVVAAGPAQAQRVGHWPGNNNTIDITSGNNGTWVGSPAYQPGEIGAAFDVTGSGHYLNVPEAAEFDFPNGQSFTLVAWVQRTGGGAPQHIVGKRSGCTGGSFYQLAVGSGAIPLSSLPLGEWHLVAVTVNFAANEAKHYVDDQVVSSSTVGALTI